MSTRARGVVEGKGMASVKLDEVMKQVEGLPPEEQLRLIAEVAGRVLGGNGEGHLVVEKSGVPVAAVISMDEYAEYKRFVAQRLHRELGREMGAAAERLGL